MASNKIQELPSIKYDQEQLIPEVIERKKWNLIYIVLCVVGIFLSILFSQGVDKIEAQKLKIAQAAVAYCEYKPKVEKLKQIGQTLNVGELVLSQFMLENLFFIDAQPYEIIHSIKRFFESEQTKTLVGSFNLTSVILNIDGRSVSEKEANSVSLNNMDTIPIKIEGKFASYTDLSSMISVLKKMTPIITITDIEFNSNNSVSFRGNVYNFQKNLFLYTYGDSYKEVNNILLAKEKYQKNKAILIEILKDKDLGLDKMGVAEIYDCKQYEDILTISNLQSFKESEIKQCKDVEKLVKEHQSELNTAFQSFIQKASMSSTTSLYKAPAKDLTEAEAGISCAEIAPITIKK